MLQLDNDTLIPLLDWPGLVDALKDAFGAGLEGPVRHQQEIPRPGRMPITLLTMPAWQSGYRFGIKCATVTADNADRGLPGVHAAYLLFDGDTGQPLATFDADNLTAWRTAAASALASRYLSREDASDLLVLGTGRVASALIEAHSTVRPIRNVTIWGRHPERAEALAERFAHAPFDITPTTSLENSVPQADIITAATMATAPLFDGDWLSPGTHVDLVGAFRHGMREVDDTTLKRADLYVDTRQGCFEEAGDLLAGFESGVIQRDDIRAELGELCRGLQPGRQESEAITLFKSVGTAIEDLAAADWFHRRYCHQGEESS